MGTNTEYDAIVVGGGPNGLTAAALLARAGLSVLLLEAKGTLGGCCRTEQLTIPGFHHDVCAAIHPMGALSPAFRELEVERHGLEWVSTQVPLAHVLEDRAVLLHASVEQTAQEVGIDAEAWRSLMRPFIDKSKALFEHILRPVRIPASPFLMARFGMTALRSCRSVVEGRFSGAAARALFAGCAAHSIMPLDAAGTASFGLVLALAAHTVGWPCARGGSAQIVRALERCFSASGGEVQTGRLVKSLAELPQSKVVLFDLTPRQIVEIAGSHLPQRYVRALKKFKYGGGVFKVDWALGGPIPWKHAACGRAATVHVGGTAEEIMTSEHEAGQGKVPERPFVLVAQQSLFDSMRAPSGNHTGWAYCHVPSNCAVDMTARIEAQIERFAPGFRDRILARHTRSPAEYEAYNPNMVGGDLGGGANSLMQFLFRPVPKYDPYATPNPRLFICSSSSSPGGGVHGMCGYWAARSAMRRLGLSRHKL